MNPDGPVTQTTAKCLELDVPLISLIVAVKFTVPGVETAAAGLIIIAPNMAAQAYFLKVVFMGLLQLLLRAYLKVLEKSGIGF
jgi:hypothetical protein